MRRRLNRLGIAALLIIITYLSVARLPSAASSSPSNLISISTAFHFTAYLALGAGFALELQHTEHGYIKAALLAASTGFLLEVVQLPLSYRFMTLNDLALNVFGGFFILADSRIGFIPYFLKLEDLVIRRVQQLAGGSTFNIRS